MSKKPMTKKSLKRLVRQDGMEMEIVEEEFQEETDRLSAQDKQEILNVLDKQRTNIEYGRLSTQKLMFESEYQQNFSPIIITSAPQIAIIGDVHLAPRQYGLGQRQIDFFKMLDGVMLTRGYPAQVCVFTGDFFDRRKIEANIFTRALEILKRYTHAHYIFVEGNHDRAVLKGEMTWLEAMAAAVNKTSGAAMMYNESSIITKKRYVPVVLAPMPQDKDAKNALVILCILDYAGANTKKKLAELIEELEKITEKSLVIDAAKSICKIYYVLIGHFGLSEYAGGNIPGTISKKDPIIEKAREKFDHIFLGHVHKHYSVPKEGKLCPMYGLGSLETMGFDEIAENAITYTLKWDEGELEAIYETHERKRKFIDVTVTIDGSKSPTEYYERMKQELLSKVEDVASHGWGKYDVNKDEIIPFADAIVRITLAGEVQFDRLKLNIPKIRNHLTKLTRALHIMIRNRLTLRGEIPQFQTHSTRAEMEIHSIMNMTEAAYAAHEENLTDLMVVVKDEVDKGSDPTAIMNIIMNSRLMEDIINADNKGRVDEH